MSKLSDKQIENLFGMVQVAIRSTDTWLGLNGRGEKLFYQRLKELTDKWEDKNRLKDELWAFHGVRVEE